MTEIIDKSVNFILKNILWITLLGFVIAPVESIFEGLIPPTRSVNQLEIIQYKLIVALLYLVVETIFTGMFAVLIGEQFYGKNIAWYQGLKKIFRKLIPLILLQLLIVIAIVLGSILLIIPGLIAICATVCATPAMMLENLSPTEAFERSCDLTKKNRFRIFLYLCLSGIVFAIANVIAEAIVMGMPMLPLYKFGLSALIIAPFRALRPAITTFLFFDLRIRKGAMDLNAV